MVLPLLILLGGVAINAALITVSVCETISQDERRRTERVAREEAERTERELQLQKQRVEEAAQRAREEIQRKENEKKCHKLEVQMKVENEVG